MLTSEGATSRALSCTSKREFGTSDHGPVVATFNGPLFDGSTLAEAPDTRAMMNETSPAPQLDLFGNPEP